MLQAKRTGSYKTVDTWCIGRLRVTSPRAEQSPQTIFCSLDPRAGRSRFEVAVLYLASPSDILPAIECADLKWSIEFSGPHEAAILALAPQLADGCAASALAQGEGVDFVFVQGTPEGCRIVTNTSLDHSGTISIRELPIPADISIDFVLGSEDQRKETLRSFERYSVPG
jgi:hypothetical protein